MVRHWRPLGFLAIAMLSALPAGAAEKDQAALLAEARRHQGLAEYAEAADGYEAFVHKHPNAGEASEALKEAVALRLGLGQLDRAREDAGLFGKNYGAKQPGESAKLALAIAGYLTEHEDFAGAMWQLQGAMAAIDAGGPVDAQITAHAWLGRAYVRLNEAKKAAAEYARVRALWADRDAVVRALESDSDTRRLGRALTALGEALFFAAEQKRKEAEAIHFPAYKGPGNKDSVVKHVSTEVVDWVKRKRPALEAAEKEYVKVVEITPAPPPKWVVASASRVGQLWGKFVAEFRAAPVPKEWKQNGVVPGTTVTYAELRRAYYEHIDEAAEPQRQRARKAFQVCVAYSVKYQYFDEYSRKCSEWLSKNDPREYHAMPEILPRWGMLDAAPQGVPIEERKKD